MQGPNFLPCHQRPQILGSSTDTLGSGCHSHHFLVSLTTKPKSRIVAYDWSRPSHVPAGFQGGLPFRTSMLGWGLQGFIRVKLNETGSQVQDCTQASNVCSVLSSPCVTYASHFPNLNLLLVAKWRQLQYHPYRHRALHKRSAHALVECLRWARFSVASQRCIQQGKPSSWNSLWPPSRDGER